MDNKGILIIILTIIVVLGIFAAAFYMINSNDNEDVKNVVTNDTLNISDVKDDNSSDIKNASLEPSSTKRHYDDWQKDYDTGLVDEYGSPIYRSVFSTSGGQYDPGIYEAYWSENGPINETRIG